MDYGGLEKSLRLSFHFGLSRNSQTNGLEQNKMVVPSCLEQMGVGGGESE